LDTNKKSTNIKGCVGPQGPQGTTLYQGNVAIVDSVYGNDITASVSGSPYKTLEYALIHIHSGQTIYYLEHIHYLLEL
jgi:hypothetical protein